MFVPPRCPYRDCERHREPVARFYRRRGFYYPKCRPGGVPRFLCKSCGHTFSRQTFRHDYRDKRPHDNTSLFFQLISGTGMRQAARGWAMDPRTVQRKQRKMAATFERLHHNLCPSLPGGRAFLLDEEETYEGASIRPLTMPVLIEQETWFVVATAVGPIRRLAKAGTARRRRQDRDEQDGKQRRPDESKRRVREVLQTLAGKVADGQVVLHTDQKSSYVSLGRAVFGDRLQHLTTSGKRVRNTRNPLFPINTTLAMTRDNCGRLRRRSWLVTKSAPRLQDHLQLFTVYRNYVRQRFNRDREVDTPARLLGLVPRNLRPEEVLAWRQDWADLSIHPMSSDGSRTVRQPMAA